MGSGTEDRARGGGIRKSAAERREQILEATISEFASRGLRGASVEDVAGRVGVSQPYVYRLFGTKKDLFLAAADLVCGRVLEAFRAAAESEPSDPLGAMGRAYAPLLARRDEMLLILQGFVADDPGVRDAVAERYAGLWRFVQEASGASDIETWNFFGSGMLLSVNAAVDLMPRLGKEEWLEKFMRDEH